MPHVHGGGGDGVEAGGLAGACQCQVRPVDTAPQTRGSAWTLAGRSHQRAMCVTRLLHGLILPYQ